MAFGGMAAVVVNLGTGAAANIGAHVVGLCRCELASVAARGILAVCGSHCWGIAMGDMCLACGIPRYAHGTRGHHDAGHWHDDGMGIRSEFIFL